MAKKTLILVRHGQYHKAEGKILEKLTTLGRKQARLAGKRLRDYPIDRIVHSTMPRAEETATIVQEETGFQGEMEACDDLRECVPGFPKHLQKKTGHTDLKKLKRDQAQLDRAFKKYFTSPKKDSVEIIVCHGNVIRYLVCRLLGADPLAWIRMDIQQCGISVVELRSEGDFRELLISHNDVGHIPMHQRTFV